MNYFPVFFFNTKEMFHVSLLYSWKENKEINNEILNKLLTEFAKLIKNDISLFRLVRKFNFMKTRKRRLRKQIMCFGVGSHFYRQDFNHIKTTKGRSKVRTSFKTCRLSLPLTFAINN